MCQVTFSKVSLRQHKHVYLDDMFWFTHRFTLCWLTFPFCNDILVRCKWQVTWFYFCCLVLTDENFVSWIASCSGSSTLRTIVNFLVVFTDGNFHLVFAQTWLGNMSSGLLIPILAPSITKGNHSTVSTVEFSAFPLFCHYHNSSLVRIHQLHSNWVVLPYNCIRAQAEYFHNLCQQTS